MKIAVLGSGAGETAVAFDCAAAGHEVALFDFEKFPENVQAVRPPEIVVRHGPVNRHSPSRFQTGLLGNSSVVRSLPRVRAL